MNDANPTAVPRRRKVQTVSATVSEATTTTTTVAALAPRTDSPNVESAYRIGALEARVSGHDAALGELRTDITDIRQHLGAQDMETRENARLSQEQIADLAARFDALVAKLEPGPELKDRINILLKRDDDRRKEEEERAVQMKLWWHNITDAGGKILFSVVLVLIGQLVKLAALPTSLKDTTSLALIAFSVVVIAWIVGGFLHALWVRR